MSDKRTGGSAFPVVIPGLVYSDGSSEPPSIEDRGMTLRDYFAAAAMQGCLSYSYCSPARGNYHENASANTVAEHAYEYADAMIEARKAPPAP